MASSRFANGVVAKLSRTAQRVTVDHGSAWAARCCFQLYLEGECIGWDCFGKSASSSSKAISMVWRSRRQLTPSTTARMDVVETQKYQRLNEAAELIHNSMQAGSHRSELHRALEQDKMRRRSCSSVRWYCALDHRRLLVRLDSATPSGCGLWYKRNDAPTRGIRRHHASAPAPPPSPHSPCAPPRIALLLLRPPPSSPFRTTLAFAALASIAMADYLVSPPPIL